MKIRYYIKSLDGSFEKAKTILTSEYGCSCASAAEDAIESIFYDDLIFEGEEIWPITITLIDENDIETDWKVSVDWEPTFFCWGRDA